MNRIRRYAAISAIVPSLLGFDPAQYKERAALLLIQGQVITVWASHCDTDPYNGWVIAYSESALTQTAVLNITPNGCCLKPDSREPPNWPARRRARAASGQTV